MAGNRNRLLLIAVLVGIPLCIGAFVVIKSALRNPLDLVEELAQSEQIVQPRPEVKVKIQDTAEEYSPAMFAGSQSCYECHADTCDSYHNHAMSISAAPTLTASELEDYTVHTQFDSLRPSSSRIQFSYEVHRDNDAVIHTEIVKDLEGEELFRIPVPVKYSIGSGKRGRSYVIDKGGRLYMSPVTWYTQGGCWDLSPAYSRNNRHFERRIIDGCVICHIGVSNPKLTEESVFLQPAFVEPAIGCERCHGAGKDHISFHSGDGSQKGLDPIVNPAKLEQGPRDSICYQCHLHGIGRITRFGKSEYGFKPGDDISKIWAVFIRGTKVDEQNLTEAVGQAEQMLVSKCYIESDGQFSCLSCHDPHDSPPDSQRNEYYDRRCNQCHSDQQQSNQQQSICVRTSDLLPTGTSTTSCVDCHMPRLLANDVPHTSQTDHRIPRHIATGPVISDDTERAELYVFGAEIGAIPEQEIACYRGILMVKNAEGSGDRFMASRSIPFLQQWIDENPNDVRTLEALGTAYWITKDLESARDIWQKGLSLDPDSELLLLRMMILCHDTGKLSEGIAHARKLVKLNPWHFEHHARLAHMLGQTNQIPAAIEEAKAALELKPWDTQVRGWLVEALRITGDTKEADKQQVLFEKCRPLQEF